MCVFSKKLEERVSLVEEKLEYIENLSNSENKTGDFEYLNLLINDLVEKEKKSEGFLAKKYDTMLIRRKIIEKMEHMKTSHSKLEFYRWYDEISYDYGYFLNTKNVFLAAVFTVFITSLSNTVNDFLKEILEICPLIKGLLEKVFFGNKSVEALILSIIVIFIITMLLLGLVRKEMREKKVYDFIKYQIDILFIDDK